MSVVWQPPPVPFPRRQPLVRLAADLDTGDGLLFERDRHAPFRLLPVRAEDWRQGRRSGDLVWARVTGLEVLPGGRRWWRPPDYPIALHCAFPQDGLLTITVLSDTPVVLCHGRPPAPDRPAPDRPAR